MGQAKNVKSGKTKTIKRVDKTRLLENLPGVVYRCANDRDWTMLDISHGCIDLFEYQPEELIGNKVVSYSNLIEPEDRNMVFNEVQKAIDEHKSFIVEYRIRTASGKIKWVWEQGVGIFSDDGKLLSLEGYITELTEARILSKEEKYRLLVENIKDAIVISQFDRFIFFNKQFASMLGYTSAELTMMDYRDVYTNTGIEILRERSARRNRGEDVPSQYETVFKRKDGTEIDVEANITIINYKGSTATFAAIRDISDRKKVELEIQKQKQYFEALYTSSPGAIVSVDMHHHIIDVNPQFERLFGYSLSEVKGKNIDDIIVPKDLLKDAKNTTKLIQKGGATVKEAKRLRKDGSLVDVSIGGAPIIVDGKQIGIIAVYMDITAIREAEEEVRKQKQYFESLFNSASDAIVSLDLTGNVVSVNPHFEKLFGYKRADIYGKNLDSFIVKKDKIEDASIITKTVQDGDVAHFERKRKCKDGSFVDVSVSGAPIIVDGEHVGVLAIYRDITERKRIEEALRESEEKYRLIVENAHDGIEITQSDKIFFANARFAEMLGYTPAEITDVKFSEIYTEQAERELYERQKNRESGKPVPNQYETTFLKKDGTIINVELKYRITDYNGEPATFAIIRDITEKKQMEEQIHQSELQFRSVWEESRDGMRLYNADGIMMRVNPAFCQIIGKPESELVGKPLSVIYNVDSADHILAKSIERFRTGTIGPYFERLITLHDGRSIWFGLSNSTVEINGEKLQLSIFRDITDRKKAEKDRERIITELQEALRQVNTLSGLIPICANCKKIRDDQGYWSDVELYISKHSDAEFSHGLCNDCMKKLYPEQYDRLRAQGKLKGN